MSARGGRRFPRTRYLHRENARSAFFFNPRSPGGPTRGRRPFVGWAEASPGLVARFVSHQRRGRMPPFPRTRCLHLKTRGARFFQSEGARGPRKGPQALCGVGGSESEPRRPFCVPPAPGEDAAPAARTVFSRRSFYIPLATRKSSTACGKAPAVFPALPPFSWEKALCPQDGDLFARFVFPRTKQAALRRLSLGSNRKRTEGRHKATLRCCFTPGPGTKRPRSPPGCSCGPERTPRSSGRW